MTSKADGPEEPKAVVPIEDMPSTSTVASVKKKRPKVRETKNGLVRDCPKCLKEIRLGTARCPHCHIFLDDRYAEVDEGSYRFARTLVLESMKEELRHWFQHTLVSTSVIGVLVALLFALGGHTVLRNLVLTEAESIIDDSVSKALRDAKSQADKIDVRLTAAADQLARFETKYHGFASMQDEFFRVANTDIVRVNARVDDLASALAMMNTRPPAPGDYRPVPVNPASRHAVDTAAVHYRGQSQVIDLEWHIPESLINGPNVLYRLEWGTDVEFSTRPEDELQGSTRETAFRRDSEHGPVFTIRVDTCFDSEEVRLDQLALAGFDTPNQARIYWRVRLLTDDQSPPLWSDVGVFDVYPPPSSERETEPDGDPLPTGAIARMLDKGEIRIGVSSDRSVSFSDYTSKGSEGASGDRSGIDIRLARSVAEWISRTLTGDPKRLKVVFVPREWLSLLSAPSRNEVELAIGTITIAEDRTLQYGLSFSRPYYTTTQSLVTFDGEVKRLDDLRSRTVVAQQGTTSLQVAQNYSDNVLVVSTSQAVFSTLAAGDAVVAIADRGIARSLRPEGARIVALSESEKRIVSEDYGIAVSRSQSELRSLVNAALEDLDKSPLQRLVGY